MFSFKSKLKSTANLLPPIRRLLLERDSLRLENEKLLNNLNALQLELRALRRKYQDAWKQLPDVWAPPGHFYSPIPRIAEVKFNEEEIFAHPPRIRGIDLNEPGQLNLLKKFATFYSEQPFTSSALPSRRYYFENLNYSYSDAIVLYCMIRHLQPRQIVEVGSGYSSCAMLDVNEVFFNNSIACTFIDPYPQLLRDLLRDADHQRVQILPCRVQDVEVEVFRKLGASDILFIDSSHVSKTGSDVNYILFKILPLLKEGVHVHFHDLFYPFEYPTDWVYEGRGWNEAYLLRAFLQYNRAFEIQFFNSYLMERHPETFESAMPLCLKRPGANLWLRKTLQDADLDRVNSRRQRTVKRTPAVLDLWKYEHALFCRDGWYPAELDHCWMTQTASVQIAGPVAQGQRLVIRAVSPHSDGVTVSASADELSLGSVSLDKSGDVAIEFLLPESLIGRPTIVVQLTLNKVHHTSGDSRKLGLAVNRIELR